MQCHMVSHHVLQLVMQTPSWWNLCASWYPLCTVCAAARFELQLQAINPRAPASTAANYIAESCHEHQKDSRHTNQKTSDARDSRRLTFLQVHCKLKPEAQSCWLVQYVSAVGLFLRTAASCSASCQKGCHANTLVLLYQQQLIATALGVLTIVTGRCLQQRMAVQPRVLNR